MTKSTRTGENFFKRLFDYGLDVDSVARRAREERVQDLLPHQEDEALGQVYDAGLLKRLFAYALPYRGRFVFAVILMVVASLTGSAGPLIIGKAIDLGVRAANAEQLQLWIALFVATSLVAWLTNRGRVMIMAYVGTRVVADLRQVLFRHLHALSLDFHNNYSVGRLMSRLVGDVHVLQDFITWSITGVFRASFSLVTILVAMLVLNWRLALVSFAVLPLIISLTRFWRARVRQTYRDTRQRISLINGYLNESITGVRVTQSFTREARNFQHFDDLNQSYFEANVRATLLAALYFPGIDFLASLAMALVVGVGGWLVLSDALTAGILVAFILYVERFFDPVRELAQRYNTFQSAMAASERLFALLDTQPDLHDSATAAALPAIEGRVDFEQVSFGYADEEPVLQDVDLHVAPGQRVALVGETGAGKTTLIKLLARFFDVDSGAILIDGLDLREVTLASLRAQLGIVLQDAFLFSGSIADNIRYGNIDAAEAEVIAAAKAVGAHPFISQLPEAYASEVGEGGGNLSVGQRQLLTCARALVADPRILILDEATSSVDTATEKQIQYALDRLMEGRTSFVIAHRLNTIVNADQILVIEDGRIVESGCHAELLAQKGRYYDLYTLQWAQ